MANPSLAASSGNSYGNGGALTISFSRSGFLGSIGRGDGLSFTLVRSTINSTALPTPQVSLKKSEMVIGFRILMIRVQLRDKQVLLDSSVSSKLVSLNSCVRVDQCWKVRVH